MKSSWIALFLALSLGLFATSYFILPQVKVGDSTTVVTQETAALKSDTLALPKLKDATFERVVLKREVVPGDTLGFILKDHYKATRDSLTAFAKTGLTQLNLNGLPSSIAQELTGLINPRESNTSKQEPRTRFVLRGIERDYLTAEIMGAEDASTEILGKLSHLNDAGKSSSSRATDLEIQLRKKQAFIVSAKRRLQEKEEVFVSVNSFKMDDKPTLTQVQRERILALSTQLPIDTQRVFAPIAGRYYRPDDGVGYIIATSPSRSVKRSQNSTKPGYTLEAGGTPVLWGTAQRQDSTQAIGASTDNLLWIVVE